MSKSFKHNPIIKYGGYSKYGKHWANKKVRNFIDLSDGSCYKKLYCSYDICDYRSNLYRTRKQDGIPIYYIGNKMTYDDIMEYWRK